MPTGLLFVWLHFAFHLYFVTIFSLHILVAIMSCTMYILFKDIKVNLIETCEVMHSHCPHSQHNFVMTILCSVYVNYT